MESTAASRALNPGSNLPLYFIRFWNIDLCQNIKLVLYSFLILRDLRSLKKSQLNLFLNLLNLIRIIDLTNLTGSLPRRWKCHFDSVKYFQIYLPYSGMFCGLVESAAASRALNPRFESYPRLYWFMNASLTFLEIWILTLFVSESSSVLDNYCTLFVSVIYSKSFSSSKRLSPLACIVYG